MMGNLVRYFKIEEFDCQETGNNKMKPDFLEKVDELRGLCGFPLTVASGYRDPSHSIEVLKNKPGTHTQGIAADLKIESANQRHILLTTAFKMGFTGIGIAKTFIHVDTRDSIPVVWTY